MDLRLAFGRVDAEGTVYVRAGDDERVVGSWLAGSPAEGLAYFGRKYDDLAAEVAILEKRVAADPVLVVTSVESWQGAVVQAAETGMRDAIGQSDLDQMLKDRLVINSRLLDLLSAAAGRF